MITRILFCLLLASVWLAGALAGEVATSDEERRAVLATLDTWNEGWRLKDAALAVADYSDDVDWTNAFGDRFQGKDALRAGLEFIFGLDFVMAGESEGNVYEDVTFLAPDIALIRSELVRVGQETDSGETMRDRHVHHLRVLQKRDGQWVIVSHLISQAKEKGSL